MNTPPINASTRYCGLFGCPVRHSASPAFQNAGILAMGLNWRYLALEVLPENLPGAIEGAKAMGFIGLNLTVPHKEQAFRLADEVEDSARLLGSINTLLFEGLTEEGWLPVRDWGGNTPRQIRSVGYNTDAEAIIRALGEDLGFSPAGKKILILGTGGAGRVAALRLATEGAAALYLVNRTLSKAESLRREIETHYPALRVHIGYPPQTETVDLVMNSTSLGLREADPLPWDGQQFCLKRSALAFDMIYRPACTPFLEAARAAGCRSANGLSMLLYQGVTALKLWSGAEPPVETMRAALREHVYSPSSPALPHA
ncbi:MAG: shikimate dehydrogenase [Verrucomicrobiota bacterium]|jgi:shikimate dehydrogenase|nr:shikimate dehydrogenase [Verrucomicrobiota bacterium]